MDIVLMSVTLATSSSSSNNPVIAVLLLLIFALVPSWIFYRMKMSKYRNKKARYEVEDDTHAVRRNLAVSDVYVKRIKGTRASTTPSRNENKPEHRAKYYNVTE